MNCQEFRRFVGAQPSIDTADVRAHARECEACASYCQELQQMDRLIQRALSIDVGSHLSTAVEQRAVQGKRARYWAIAASVVATIALGSFLWLTNPSASFAEQLISHVQHEADSLVRTPDRVEAGELTTILKRSGVRLKPSALNVSYAMSCWFRGHYVPHLVVQSAHGPITVLVLRHEEPMIHPQRFDEAGFTGEIVAAPQGALAILGRDVPIAGVAATVLEALEYQE